MRIEEIVAAHGTPAFIYDLPALRARLARARAAFGDIELYYAVKANPALARFLAKDVDGFDVASAGELARVRAVAPSAAITFAGPGKRAHELEALGDATLVAESIEELARAPRDARVLLRLNPIERVRAFAVSTAGGPSQFGVDEEQLGEAIAVGRELDGIHVHAGSQCSSARAFLRHVEIVLGLATRLLREHGVCPRRVCFGGGLGVASESGAELDVERLGAEMRAAIARWADAHAVPKPVASIELGRWLVADVGVYVARVVSTKRSRGVRFAVLDGGLNHLLLATGLLGNPPLPARVLNDRGEPRAPVTLTGPLCTPLDVLGRALPMPPLVEGDLVVFDRAGAYGASLSPARFLGHGPARELAVDGAEIFDLTEGS